MACKDCIHFEMCNRTDMKDCPRFEDRSQFVKAVHGRWDDECRCTVCGWYGEDWYKRDVYYFDYCPNCGAKMDGGDTP